MSHLTVTKTYGHDLGLSCVFRQWRARSHCSKLHGYALSFEITFSARELDENGWVIDFGSLKPIKRHLEDTFDHKLIVAQDDPHLKVLREFAENDVVDMIVLPATGCEAFAKYVFNWVLRWLDKTPRVSIVSVTVREHGANAATYHGDPL